jgi:hypothetical protein
MSAGVGVWAQDFGAVRDGIWSDPTIWMPEGGPPGLGDEAYIGSDYPEGSVPDATVSLSGDQSISDLYLGYSAGNSGTLDLAGFNLVSDGGIFLGRNFFRRGGNGTIIHNNGSLSAELLASSNDFTFGSLDTVDRISFDSGATVRTVNSQNVSNGVFLFDADTTLTMGADLILDGEIRIEGSQTARGTGYATLDANGMSITSQVISIGNVNGSGGEILNHGPIATGHMGVSASTFAFDVDDRAESLSILSNGTVNIVDTANVRSTISVLGRLDLGADLVLSNQLNLRAALNVNGLNITAPKITIGPSGEYFNAGTITATEEWEVCGQTFSFGDNDTVFGVVRVNGGIVNMHANTAARELEVLGGGALNTVATENVETRVTVSGQGIRFSRSRLNLGAELALAGSLDINGTAVVDAQGFGINAPTIFVGRFHTTGNLLNEGGIHAGSLFLDRSKLTLKDGDDHISVALGVRFSSELKVVQMPSQTRGLTLNGNSLDIDQASTLKLEFDGNRVLGQDWAFRWANPRTGNRVSALSALVDSGRILVNSPHATRIFDGGDGYTYIGAVPR